MIKGSAVFFLLAALLAGCSLFREEAGPISVRTDKAHYRVGDRATVQVVNRSDHIARFVLSCSYYLEQQDAAAWEVVYEAVCPPNVRVAAVVIRPGASEKALVRILVDDTTAVGATDAFRLRFRAFTQDGTPLRDETASSNAFRLTR